MFKIEAATGGLLMNMAFLLTGTTSTNPVLAILGVLLILAWKNADYIGLDYFLLPLLGTPWKQKALVPRATPTQRTPAVAARESPNRRSSEQTPGGREAPGVCCWVSLCHPTGWGTNHPVGRGVRSLAAR